MTTRQETTRGIDAILDRLEELFAERTQLIEEYSTLWAIHGGGSQTWEDNLIDVDMAPLRVEIRKSLSSGGKQPTEARIKEALYSSEHYRSRLAQTVKGRTTWARVREQMRTIDWRIQLEMAKLRLNLGDDATPTTPDSDGATE